MKKLILIIFLIIISISTQGYKVEENKTTHQFITRESGNILPLISYEIISKLNNSIEDPINLYINFNYDSDDDIITGSGEEDAFGRFIHHFWNPDNPNDDWDNDNSDYNDGLENFDSSFTKVRTKLWHNNDCKKNEEDCGDVVSNYIRGNLNESYYYLGRIAHLIQDASAPPHVLLDPHADSGDLIIRSPDSDEYNDDSILEEFLADNFHNYTASNLNIIGKPYHYEYLISSWDNDDWNEVNTNLIKTDYPSNLFKLFWYTAQKTQYWASDDKDGNEKFKKSDGTEYNFSNINVNLWNEENYSIISLKNAFFNGDLDDSSNEDFYYSLTNTGQNCKQIYGGYCESLFEYSECYYCDPNDGDNVALEAEAMMSHAMKATAGLYQLFWDTVNSYHWPTYHHDNRRTGFTILKGDIHDENDIKESSYKISDDPIEEYDRPSVADIDGNGLMNIVISTSNTNGDPKGKIYSLEWIGEYDIPIFAYNWIKEFENPLTAAPSLGNTDTDTEKEIAFGLQNGSFYILENNGSIAWESNISEKYSAVYDDYILGQLEFSAIADLDNDGFNEIIFNDFSSTAYYDWQGHMIIASKKSGDYQIINITEVGFSGTRGAVSIANLDDYPNLEIVVPTTYGIYVYNFTDNFTEEIWHNNHGAILGAVAISDIDFDNQYELIYTTADRNCAGGMTCNDTLYIVSANGTVLRSRNLDFISRTTPAVADIDNDGIVEIILVAENSASTVKGQVLCYKANTLNMCDGFPYNDSNALEPLVAAPNIADINGDGSYDIIIGTRQNETIIINADGTQLFRYNYGSELGSVPIIADIKNKGVAEIVTKISGSSVMTILSGSNEKPILSELTNRTINVNELFHINDSGQLGAYDYNNDTLVYYYGLPLNSTGHFAANSSYLGNYSILVEVTDGNLSDWQYLNLELINQTGNLPYCSYGESYFADNYTVSDGGIDRDNICRSSDYSSDCTASFECNSNTAGTGHCTTECNYKPSIITYPNGYEWLEPDSIVTINWTDTPFEKTSYSLDYSNDSGITWNNIATDIGLLDEFNDSTKGKSYNISGSEAKIAYLKLLKNKTIFTAFINIEATAGTYDAAQCYVQTMTVKEKYPSTEDCNSAFENIEDVANDEDEQEDAILVLGYPQDYNDCVPQNTDITDAEYNVFFDDVYYGGDIRTYASYTKNNTLCSSCMSWNEAFSNCSIDNGDAWIDTTSTTQETWKSFNITEYLSSSHSNNKFFAIRHKADLVGDRTRQDLAGSDSNSYLRPYINISYYKTIKDPIIYINNSLIWNITGTFEDNETTEDFASIINTQLSSCTADASGYCTIPLKLEVDGYGEIKINDIQIYYNISEYEWNISGLENSSQYRVKINSTYSENDISDNDFSIGEKPENDLFISDFSYTIDNKLALLKYEITNNNTNTSSIDWTFNTGESNITSQSNITIEPNQTSLLYIYYNYTQYSSYSTAFFIGDELEYAESIEVPEFQISDLRMLSSDGNLALFRFDIWNYDSVNKSSNFELLTDNSNITSSNSLPVEPYSSHPVYIYNTYNGTGNYIVHVLASNGVDDHEKEINIKI